MFDNQQQGTVSRREITIISAVALALVVVAVALLLMSSSREPSGVSNPAETVAREEIDQIYQQELAAAKAAALANEEARQAELKAAEEAIAALENTSAAAADDLPPQTEGQPVVPPSIAAPVPTGTAAPPPESNVPPGWVRTKDGELVNMQAIVDSVKAQGTKQEQSDD